MHLHAWYIERFVKEQEPILSQCSLHDIFSLSKNELFIQWLSPENTLVNWRIQWEANSCFISFPDELNVQARKRLKQFQDIHGQYATHMTTYSQDRSFELSFKNGSTLLFKLHGPNANVVLFNVSGDTQIFRLGQKSDLDLKPNRFSTAQSWSLDDLKNFAWYKKLPSNAQELDYDQLKQLFLTKEIHLNKLGNSYQLSPFENSSIAKYSKITDAWNDFAGLYLKSYHFHKEKQSLIERLERDIKHKSKLYKSLEKRVNKLNQGSGYRHWGDLLFSNLTQIEEGQKEVEVIDYLSGNPLTIPLKEKLSPQENAERYYKKAKNEGLELEFALNNLNLSKQEVANLEIALESVEKTETWKELKPLLREKNQQKPQESRKEYHHFYFKGFSILVGKSAKDNDVLSFQVAKKDDLWLHARDVSGSHVVIKHRSGQGFPEDVIEYAASLAAWFSKRKTESLCPVIYTPKKFIRKRKGALPGQVQVDKESVIMVEPSAPIQI